MGYYNLNEPDYHYMGLSQNGSMPPEAPASPSSDMLSQGLQGGASGASAGASSGNPYAAAGLGIAGIALGAYGSYEQSKSARRQYAHMVDAWKADQARQARLEDDARAQQAFTDALATAQYGQGVKKIAHDDYGSYARAYGL